MKVNDVDIDVNDLCKGMKFEMHKNYHGILLTDSQVNILKNYGFNIEKYSDIKELMFDLGEYLEDDPDNDELDYIYEQLAEFNYYNYTTK